MTTMDVRYGYAADLNPDQIRAVARLSDVYGIRKLQVDEAAHAIAIEYDATRMDEPRLRALLRATGVDVAEQPALSC